MKIAMMVLALMLGQTIDESRGRKYQPGDVITVTKEASKVIRLYSAGTPDKPITLNCRGVSLRDTYIELMSGANHWIIDGLVMQGGPRLLDAYKANGLTLRNCSFGPIDNGGSYCVRITSSNNISITNCRFRSFNSVWRSPQGVNSDGLVLDNCNDGRICYNQFGDAGHVALNIRNSARNLIAGNDVANHLHTGIAIINIPGNSGNATGNIVEYNRVRFFNKRPSDAALPGVGVELLYASGNTVRHNEISDGRSTGITLAANAALGVTRENIIANNTIYKPGQRGIEIGMFGVITSDTVTGNKITKNLIVGTWPNDVRGASIAMTFKDWATTGNEVSGNFMAPPSIKLRHDTGYTVLDAAKLQTITGNPKFVWAGIDFHLRPGSPAAGCGAFPFE